MPRRVCRCSFHDTLHCTSSAGRPAAANSSRAPRPGEEAPLVDMTVEVDEYRAGEGRGLEDHGTMWALGIGTMNWPPHSRMPAIWAMISSLKFQGRMKT